MSLRGYSFRHHNGMCKLLTKPFLGLGKRQKNRRQSKELMSGVQFRKRLLEREKAVF